MLVIDSTLAMKGIQIVTMNALQVNKTCGSLTSLNCHSPGYEATSLIVPLHIYIEHTNTPLLVSGLMNISKEIAIYC